MNVIAQDIARPPEAEHHLATADFDIARLHVSVQQDEDAIPGLALVPQALAADEPAAAAQLQQRVAIAIGQQRQKGAGLSTFGEHETMLSRVPLLLLLRAGRVWLGRSSVGTGGLGSRAPHRRQNRAVPDEGSALR
jgi:hypothetical protein